MDQLSLDERLLPLIGRRMLAPSAAAHGHLRWGLPSMGKRSKEKLARRKQREFRVALAKQLEEEQQRADAAFVAQRTALRQWLSSFHPEDVVVAISISNLWMPNISSLAKHSLAFGVAASIAPDHFDNSHRLETYTDFCGFISQLQALLPSFEPLEDFVPDTDWGEMRIRLHKSILRCFYGGSVERLPDFVAGFLIVHASDEDAIRSIRAVLEIQDHVITHIDRSVVGSAEDIRPGHIEVPAEPFWTAARKLFLGLPDLSQVGAIDTKLVVSLGSFQPPMTWSQVADGMMTGKALPAVLLEIAGRRFPIALREAPAAVIQHWADRSSNARSLAHSASKGIGNFLAQRFRSVEAIAGPLQLRNREQTLPYRFSALMLSDARTYLFIALAEAELQQLPAIEKAVKRILNHGPWAIQKESEAQGLLFRKSDGSQPPASSLVLITVLARLTTVPGLLKLPRGSSAHVLPLPDFVTLFDSIENLDELDRYWAFETANTAVGGPVGPIDRFAAFRDSHALLAGGAVEPNFIGLDPLWGSGWRYRELKRLWANAPRLFPDDQAPWKAKRSADGLYQLVNRARPTLAWCAEIGSCVVHFVFEMIEQTLKLEDGQILELAVHCLADVLQHRAGIIASLPLFAHRRIVTICRANPDRLISADDEDEDEESDRPTSNTLFSNWKLETTPEHDVCAHVDIDLHGFHQWLGESVDARFEVEAALAWMDGLAVVLGLAATPPAEKAQLQATADQRQRFAVKTVARSVDVPQFIEPVVPKPEQYKLARKHLAIVFKALGAEPGTYELAAAKALIDPARNRYRALIHERIEALYRDDLVAFCIEQLDGLMAAYDTESAQIRLSLTHDVSYDRRERMAKAHEDFVRDSRNYRYLLECSLSAPASDDKLVSAEVVVELVGMIDWLLVLYVASDVLHNDIDVAGLELDHFYVPHAFYSENFDQHESAFATEHAETKLGIGLSATDEVREAARDSAEWQRVNSAFVEDVGVRLNQFLAGLTVLSRWPSANKRADLHLSYTATREQLCSVLLESVEDLDAAEADSIVSMATLRPTRIRRLIGKSIDESDVPIWEHHKRGDRYTIKPLIEESEGSFRWGAAAAERACRIWRATIANGYLPADYDWPHVEKAVRAIKEKLEDRLEVVAHSIVQRGTPFALRGADFMHRFPKEHFVDVGDYDVLAYWPSTNCWLMVECKYNKPTFCLKDARRLRDNIFGAGSDRKQFAKIERRRHFLTTNAATLRALLGWPSPVAGLAERFSELYVSRDTSWWMRNPPYPVPTEFVRVDALSQWMEDSGLLD